MKITMLGISGSGKTSLMAALHERFSNNRVENYSIQPVSREGSVESIIVGDWDAISFANNDYEWHAGTTETTVWSFDLVHTNHVITQFDWIDYRGGILTDIARNAGDEEEKIDLINHIFMSNALIITIDAFLLTYYDNINQARQETGINIIQSILEKYKRTYPERDLVFAVALTKSDCVDDKWKANNYAALTERAMEALNFLNAYSLDWRGGIVPISAVGDGVVERTVLAEATLKALPQTQDVFVQYPTPENIEHLLFFCVGNILDQMKGIAQTKIGERQKQIEAAVARSNSLNTFWAWLMNGTSHRDIASALLEEQKQDREALSNFEQFITPLITTANQKVRKI